jgi:hypothetical protein
MYKRLTSIIVLLLALAAPAHAADVNADRIEVILFPLAFVPLTNAGGEEIAGALGTIWTGNVWVENRGSQPVHLHPCEFQCNDVVSGVIRLFDFPMGPHPDLGYLYEARAEEAANLRFSNRIFERSRRGQPRGVNIPVVREGEFFTQSESFLAVPSGNGVRISLRVYDPWIHYPPPARPGPALPLKPGPALESVRIEILNPAGATIAETSLRPAITYLPIPQRQFDALNRTRPGMASIHHLAGLFPQLNDNEHVHIRVTPVPADAQYWAFVSVTDNDTQTVSVITAQ